MQKADMDFLSRADGDQLLNNLRGMCVDGGLRCCQLFRQPSDYCTSCMAADRLERAATEREELLAALKTAFRMVGNGSKALPAIRAAISKAEGK